MSTPFHAGEMAILRKDAEELLIAKCSITRRTEVSDGSGGRTFVPNVIYTNVRCRLSPVRNDFEQERKIAERLGASVTWILSVPFGTDINLKDAITMTDPIYNNEMEVQAVVTTPRSISTVIRVVVMETK